MNFISVDVETTGLIPGYNNLLSVGAVDLETNEKFHYVLSSVDAYESRLNWDKGTKVWWNGQETAKARLKTIYTLQGNSLKTYNSNHQECARLFSDWLEEFEGIKYFVAWPASFDYPYIQHLFNQEGIENPFSHRTIDVKSYACGKLGIDFDTSHENFPILDMKPDFPHDALSDAIAQNEVFKKLLKFNDGVPQEVDEISEAIKLGSTDD